MHVPVPVIGIETCHIVCNVHAALQIPIDLDNTDPRVVVGSGTQGPDVDMAVHDHMATVIAVLCCVQEDDSDDWATCCNVRAISASRRLCR